MNVFDLTVTFKEDVCPFGRNTFNGITVPEAGTGRHYAVPLNDTRTSVIVCAVEKA